jgi:hypothetical protein
MIGRGPRGGAVGICATGSGAHFGCGSGKDYLVVLSRGTLHNVRARNAGGQRRTTGEFRRPRDDGTTGCSGWESRRPSLAARTVLHCVPPFALTTNMAARPHNTSLLTDARVVPSLVLDRPNRYAACHPQDAGARREIRRRRHAANVPPESRHVPSSRRGCVHVGGSRQAGQLHTSILHPKGRGT